MSDFEDWIIEVVAPPPIGPDDLLWCLRDKLSEKAARRLRGNDELIEEGDEIELMLLPKHQGRILTASLVNSPRFPVYDIPSLPGLFEQLLGCGPNASYDLEVTLPADYPVGSLAAQSLVIIARIGQAWEIELPEFDDPLALKSVGLSCDLDTAMAELAREVDAQQAREILASGARCVLERLADSLPDEVSEQVVAEELKFTFEQKILPILRDLALDAHEVAEARRGYLDDPEARDDALHRIRATLALKAVGEVYQLEVDDDLLITLEDDNAENLGISLEDFSQILESHPELDDRLGSLAEKLTALQFVCSKVQFVFPDEPSLGDDQTGHDAQLDSATQSQAQERRDCVENSSTGFL